MLKLNAYLGIILSILILLGENYGDFGSFNGGGGGYGDFNQGGYGGGGGNFHGGYGGAGFGRASGNPMAGFGGSRVAPNLKEEQEWNRVGIAQFLFYIR